MGKVVNRKHVQYSIHKLFSLLTLLQGDHKLDYSAEIYHYQQTKSQISAMEKYVNLELCVLGFLKE